MIEVEKLPFPNLWKAFRLSGYGVTELAKMYGCSFETMHNKLYKNKTIKADDLGWFAEVFQVEPGELI